MNKLFFQKKATTEIIAQHEGSKLTMLQKKAWIFSFRSAATEELILIGCSDKFASLVS